MLKHMFQKKTINTHRKPVDLGRFKPAGLTRFNLTRFSPQPVGLTRFKLTRFLTAVEPPGSNRVSKHYVNPQILKLLLLFIYNL